jgi:predicted protein tyrosine phosphatase
MNITVLDLNQAYIQRDEFDAVISLVDHPSVLEFTHPNHHIEVFLDDEDPRWPKSPKLEHVERIFNFVSTLSDDANVMVHCHAGMCRSTAIAIAIEAKQGKDPVEAAIALEARHFKKDWFFPNRLVLRHVGTLLQDDFLHINVNKWMMTLPVRLL